MSFCINLGDSWETVFDDEDHVNDPEDEESYEQWSWIELKKRSDGMVDIFVAMITIDNDVFDGYERTIPSKVYTETYIGVLPVHDIDPFHIKDRFSLLRGVEKRTIFDSNATISRSYFDGNVSALVKDIQNKGGPIKRLLSVIDEIDREYLNAYDDMDKEFIK